MSVWFVSLCVLVMAVFDPQSALFGGWLLVFSFVGTMPPTDKKNSNATFLCSPSLRHSIIIARVSKGTRETPARQRRAGGQPYRTAREPELTTTAPRSTGAFNFSVEVEVAAATAASVLLLLLLLSFRLCSFSIFSSPLCLTLFDMLTSIFTCCNNYYYMLYW